MVLRIWARCTLNCKFPLHLSVSSLVISCLYFDKLDLTRLHRKRAKTSLCSVPDPSFLAWDTTNFRTRIVRYTVSYKMAGSRLVI